jgi:peptide/nickel transport system permease protein
LRDQLKQVASRWARRSRVSLRALLRSRSSTLGAAIVFTFLLVALFGPIFAPYNVNQQIPEDAGQAPNASHWFGVDHIGRDVYSRVLLGAREILLLAGSGTTLAVLIGTTFGLFSGYRGGWIDEALMRVFDAQLSLPALLLALLLLGSLGPSRWSIIVVLMVVYTPIVARVVRSVVLSVKVLPFVEAARLQGGGLGEILFLEILPSALPALAVESALRFSYAIFLVASLGFLGVGVSPPNPNWGLMVKEARTFVYQTPWALYFPAGAIAVVVVGVNLFADSLKKLLQTQGEVEPR